MLVLLDNRADLTGIFLRWAHEAIIAPLGIVGYTAVPVRTWIEVHRLRSYDLWTLGVAALTYVILVVIFAFSLFLWQNSSVYPPIRRLPFSQLILELVPLTDKVRSLGV